MLEHYKNRCENFIQNHLPQDQNTLSQAMRYSVLNGGKRLRAALIYASAETLNCDHQALDYSAAAIEYIHAYSLIHDDLPAMDDDALRRGKPSCHKAFGEACAILAGDALNTLAFATLSQSPLHPEIKIKQIQCLSKAAGHKGMVGGQSLDIEGGNTLQQLQTIHQGKTGALIKCALQLGTSLAQITQEQQALINHIGDQLGMAYQIHDDILDLTSDSQTLGKTAGKDQTQNKLTYPALIGLKASEKLLEEIKEDIAQQLKKLKENSPLHQLISYIFNRKH